MIVRPRLRIGQTMRVAPTVAEHSVVGPEFPTAECSATVSATVMNWQPGRTRAKRQGMTLLEVVLALAILAMALGLLGQLVQNGARAAASARDETRAQLACESVLAGVVSGAIAAQSVDGFPYEADPEWSYSLEVQPANTYGLISVRVSVVQNIADATRPTEFALVRWMRDPSVVEEIEALEAAEAAAAAAASDTSGGL